ncbi:MAG: hypothetical protein NUW01_09385 [Gemmatimonadaceae bacterium]|nr:hypothetical protein [Gemmatimonadaceae bacterium]
MKVVNVGRTQRAILNAAMILHEPSYGYDFGDGWAARVDVRQIEAPEARKLRRITRGFCGYDWMVDEILHEGRILTLAERATAGEPAA